MTNLQIVPDILIEEAVRTAFEEEVRHKFKNQPDEVANKLSLVNDRENFFQTSFNRFKLDEFEATLVALSMEETFLSITFPSKTISEMYANGHGTPRGVVNTVKRLLEQRAIVASTSTDDKRPDQRARHHAGVAPIFGPLRHAVRRDHHAGLRPGVTPGLKAPGL